MAVVYDALAARGSSKETHRTIVSRVVPGPVSGRGSRSATPGAPSAILARDEAAQGKSEDMGDGSGVMLQSTAVQFFLQESSGPTIWTWPLALLTPA